MAAAAVACDALVGGNLADDIADPQLVHSLLDLITTGQYATVGVGTKSDIIPLDGAAQTVADFLSRLPSTAQTEKQKTAPP